MTKNQPKKSIIYGRHPIIDAIKSGTPIDKIVLQQGIRGEFEKEATRGEFLNLISARLR